MVELLAGFMGAAGNLAIAMTFAGLWTLNRTQVWNAYWACAHGAGAVMLLLGRPGAMPLSTELFLLLSVMAASGVTLHLGALAAYLDRDLSKRALISVAALIFAVAWTARLGGPRVTPAIIALLLAALFFFTSYVFLKVPRLLERATGVFFALRGLNLFAYPVFAHFGISFVAFFGAYLFTLLSGLGLLLVAFARLQRELIEARDQLHASEARVRHAQKLGALGQLTGGIAHDFNNLLAAIGGNAELARMRIGNDSRLIEHNNAILRSVDRGAALTQRLLTFSRRSELSPAATDVQAALKDVHTMLARTLGETMEVVVDSPADLWYAAVDGHQLEDAVLNLALNARDAMPEGGKLTIRLRNRVLNAAPGDQTQALSAGDYVEISVVDGGQGMAPETIEKAYEPFFTTKDFGRGSGLGLSMVYGFVTQSRGDITIESAPGEGTTVTLLLPRAMELQAVAQRSSPPLAEQADGTVLLAEDDVDVRDVAASMLRATGYQVITAASGDEALDRVRDTPGIDVLCADIVMPGGMSGYQLATRALDERADIKVLYMTGYADEPGGEEAAVDGPVLHKPYSAFELASAVGALMARPKA